MYTIMYIQCAQFFDVYIFLHKLVSVKFVHPISKQSKESTQFCILNVHNFLCMNIFLHPSIISWHEHAYMSWCVWYEHVWMQWYNAMRWCLLSSCDYIQYSNFQKMYTILYIKKSVNTTVLIKSVVAIIYPYLSCIVWRWNIFLLFVGELWQYTPLCLVHVKYFPENKYFPEMLFSGKENLFRLFGCLGIRFMKNQFQCLVRSNILRKMLSVLRKINSHVWFVDHFTENMKCLTNSSTCIT